MISRPASFCSFQCSTRRRFPSPNKSSCDNLPAQYDSVAFLRSRFTPIRGKPSTELGAEFRHDGMRISSSRLTTGPFLRVYWFQCKTSSSCHGWKVKTGGEKMSIESHWRSGRKWPKKGCGGLVNEGFPKDGAISRKQTLRSSPPTLPILLVCCRGISQKHNGQ